MRMRNLEDSFAKSVVRTLLERQGAECIGPRRGREIWIKGITVIRLPENNSRIHFDEVHMIATEQLE